LKEGYGITDRYLALLENNTQELIRLGRSSVAVQNALKFNHARIVEVHRSLGRIIQWLDK
jgi:hypothetical protein